MSARWAAFPLGLGRLASGLIVYCAWVSLAMTLISSTHAADAKLHADLRHVATQRVYFGHQSVGGNILDGVKQLAGEARVPLSIVEAAKVGDLRGPAFGHTPVEENEKPLLKLESFERAMQGAAPDVALMKFCYVDIGPDTDVKTLFERYRASADRLRARYPNTTLVHVTAPLTLAQVGAKAALKRLLGKAPAGILDNLRRQEYNDLLRKTYQGREPIFDLARVESTSPDGKPVSSEWQGKTVPYLAAAYTDDGGHLNDLGKRRAARELLAVLAAIPEKKPEPGASPAPKGR
jgi:hypothetical protein